MIAPVESWEVCRTTEPYELTENYWVVVKIAIIFAMRANKALRAFSS